MDVPEYPQSQVPYGYLSEQDKRKFTITAGILGAVFFLFQIVLPFIITFAAMPLTMFAGDTYRELDVGSMVLWEDYVWFVEESSTSSICTLKKMTLNEPRSIETVCKLPAGTPDLIAGADELWIVSRYYVSQYTNSGLGPVTRSQYPGNFRSPFLLQNRPAVLEDTPDGTSIIVFDAGTWQRKYEIDLNFEEKQHSKVKNLQVLNDGVQLHIYIQLGYTLYYKSFILNSDMDNTGQWETIGYVDDAWKAVSNGIDIFVFTTQSARKGKQIVAYTKRGNTWQSSLYYQVPYTSDIGVCTIEGTEKFFLLTQSFPGFGKVLEIEGSDVIKSESFRKGFPFNSKFQYLLFVPHSVTVIMPLILAFILSGMMRKHRNCDYRADLQELPFASLVRRALAQIVDGLILGGPFILSFIFMISIFTFPEALSGDDDSLFSPNLNTLLLSPLLMCAGFPWMIIWLLIFSATEGSSGVTPGKWILGIRVLGTDLMPCGFGRALIRNLLKFVDGFFNFMVGVMVAALSDNWQRVGDMAARTIVVDIKNNKYNRNVYKVNINHNA